MNFEWIDYYTEFATKLLTFKDNREELIHKIYSIYDNIGISVPKLEKDDEITDIDPFTVFGLFNKGITYNNRILILNGIASEFQISANIPVNFDGVPVLNNLKATFYSFIDERNDSDIDNIWELFEAAINFSESNSKENRQRFIEYYNIVHEQRCIKWNITIGLYWIRPYTFINLDSRNRWYMVDTNNMPDEFINAINKKLNKVPYAEEYLEIRDICQKTFESAECKYKSFPELSYYAWIESERVNKELKSEDKRASKAYFLQGRQSGGTSAPHGVDPREPDGLRRRPERPLHDRLRRGGRGHAERRAAGKGLRRLCDHRRQQPRRRGRGRGEVYFTRGLTKQCRVTWFYLIWNGTSATSRIPLTTMGCSRPCGARSWRSAP